MTETHSSLFNIDDCFRVVDGPWKGVTGKITAIYDEETFNYIDCNTGKLSVLLYYVLEEWSKKLDTCEC